MLIEPLGYAAAEGLNISIDFTESPLDATQSVAHGEHDITEVNTLFAFLRREERIRVKAYYSVCRAPYRSFAVLEDSPITTLKDLRGKRVGMDHPALLGLAEPVLREADVDPADILWMTDYLRDVVPNEEDLARIPSGELDALWVLADSFEMLKAAGIPLRRLPAPTFDTLIPGACLYARTSALEGAERDTLAAYGRCVAKATEFCSTDPQAAVELIWEHYPETRPADENRAEALIRDTAAIRGRNIVSDLRHGTSPLWGGATPREITAWEEFLIRNDVVKVHRQPSEYFDFTLLKHMQLTPINQLAQQF